jgi:hypothetical protein
MRIHLNPAVAVTIVSLVLVASVEAQEPFLGWVGIYAPARIGWLENENRIDALCAEARNRDTCRSDMLRPAVDTFVVYAGPDEGTERRGAIVVETVPGRGLSAAFRAAEADTSIRFAPDVYLQDWGYGPYFHQTVTQRTGEWFQLPPSPWPEAVWVRIADHDGSLLHVHTGDIVELDGEGMYVVATEADAVQLRREQPADLWCREGDPPPLVEDVPTRYSRAQLLDDDGHLRIRPKYMKGC